MKLLQVTVLLIIATTALLVSGCGSNCTYVIPSCQWCMHRITFVDTDGNVRVAYTLPGGNEAIISNCQSVTGSTVVDMGCCII
jgi:hypothetical protein